MKVSVLKQFLAESRFGQFHLALPVCAFRCTSFEAKVGALLATFSANPANPNEKYTNHILANDCFSQICSGHPGSKRRSWSILKKTGW